MCNKTISVLMPLTFYFSIFLGIWIPNMSPFGFSYPEGYAFSTMQPISRLPLFWIGVFAGILCIRIQNGDLSALDSKTIIHGKNCIITLLCFHVGFRSSSKNFLTTFLEEAHFLPFLGKKKRREEERMNPKDEQISRSRSVDVNMSYYLGLLALLSLLNIVCRSFYSESGGIDITRYHMHPYNHVHTSS